jgi:D-sedoheptulose 7-phosphate isomerase
MKHTFLSQANLLTIMANDKSLHKQVSYAIESLTSALKQNLPVLVFGNGGSASDALHISGELVGKFNFDRRPYNVICLNSNVTVLTAWSNDVNYDSVFARQVEAHSVSGGICWGLSTSGNSGSVLLGLKKGQSLGMKTIGLTGASGGKMSEFCDILIEVPSEITPIIQELHVVIYHYICKEIESKLSQSI